MGIQIILHVIRTWQFWRQIGKQNTWRKLKHLGWPKFKKNPNRPSNIIYQASRQWPQPQICLFPIVFMPLNYKWAASSEFVSSSIPSWQILTAHAQTFRGAMDLAFCVKIPFDSLLVWGSSEGSGETARMRRLAWTFPARIGYKYQIRLTRSKWIWSNTFNQ